MQSQETFAQRNAKREYFAQRAKKDMLKADPIPALQYNQMSDSCPFKSDEQINCGSIMMPLANNIEKPMSHHHSFLE